MQENNAVISVTGLVTEILNDMCLVDAPNHADENFVLASCDYIKFVLKEIYGDTLKKVVYDELLEQLVYQHFGERLYDCPYHFQETEEEKQELRDRFLHLKTVPQPAQRSDAWYIYRNGRITASDAAGVFEKNAFKTRTLFLQEKIDPASVPGFGINDIVLHGIRLEDSICNIYQHRMGNKVEEFGCIPHDTLPYLGASPDGIDTEGVMLEIKCPYSRPIYECPPIYYWYQIQLQLEVADLNRCDYVECELEVISEEKYTELMKSDLDRYRYETGCLVEYYDEKLGKIGHSHAPFGMRRSVTKAWGEDEAERLINISHMDYRNTLYWVVHRYSCIPIYRNRRWFERATPKFEAFWKDVLEGREAIRHGKVPKVIAESQERELNRKPRVKKPNVCLLLSDSDEE